MTMHTVLDIALMVAVVATAWYARMLRALVGSLTVRVMAVANDMLRDRAAFNKELDRLKRELDIIREECRKAHAKPRQVSINDLPPTEAAITERQREMLRQGTTGIQRGDSMSVTITDKPLDDIARKALDEVRQRAAKRACPEDDPYRQAEDDILKEERA